MNITTMLYSLREIWEVDRLKTERAALLDALKDTLREYGKLAFETNQPTKEPAAIEAARALIAELEAA